MHRNLLILSLLSLSSALVSCGRSEPVAPDWREISLEQPKELSPQRERLTLSIGTREQRDALVLEAARKSGESREYAPSSTHRYAIPGPRKAHLSFTPIEHLGVACYCQQDLLAVTFGTSSRESVLPLFVSDGLAGAPRVWQSPASPETLILFEVNSHVACGSAGSSFELIAVDFDRGTARSLARAAYEEHLLDGRDAASITSHGQSELEIRIRIPRDSAPHERPLLDVEPVSDDVIVRTVSRCEIAIRVHSDAGRGVGSCSRCGLR